MHGEAKQYWNIQVWNTEKFIMELCKEMLILKKKKKKQTFQKLLAKPFYSKGERGVASCCKLLDVWSFFPEVTDNVHLVEIYTNIINSRPWRL